MARISTVFDEINEEMQKVFMVRGDESYARTTDVIFSINSSFSSNSLGYVLTANVDVLRDLGTSTLTFYDNDEVLYVCDWTSSTSATAIELPRISWDVEHIIYVKYDGNTQCLKSQSDKISVIKSNPNLTDTTLTDTTSTKVYTSTQNITVSTKLDRASGSASLENHEIEYYVDDALIDTTLTNSTGASSLNIGTLSNGIHDITAQFDGESPLGSSEVTFQVGVGYDLTIMEYPSVFVNGVNNPVKVLVVDKFGNPKSGASVSFGNASASTNSNGIATINVTSISNNSAAYATYGNYTSDTVTVYSFTPSSISLDTVDGVTVTGVMENITVSIQGTGTVSNVPITVTGAMAGTYYTGANGTLVLNYLGTGAGDVTITAQVGNKTANTTVVDAFTLLKTTETMTSYDMDTVRTTITDEGKTNGFVIRPTDARQYGYVTFDAPCDYWEATFDLVTFSGKYRNGITINNARLDYNWGIGNKVKVIKGTDGIFKVIRDGTTVLENMSEPSGLLLTVNENTGTTNCIIRIDNLVMKEITE